jgi:putative FmdB family regulatory protein
MPLYEYSCACGRRLERLRPIDKRSTPVDCPCGLQAKHVPSMPARTAFSWGDTKWDGFYDRGLNVTLRDKNHRKAVMKQRGLRELQPGEVEAEQSRVLREHEQHEKNIKTYTTALKETGSTETAMARTFPNPEV